MLILAAVSISILLGDNGIIKKVKDAKEVTIIGNEKEGIILAYTACNQQNMFEANVTDIQLQTQMNKEGRNVSVISSGENLIVTYKDTNHQYKVNQDGTIEEFTSIPEETSKIIDLVCYNDDELYVLTASGEVTRANIVNGDFFDILQVDTNNIISTNGIRKVLENVFIDNEGKVYTWGENYSGEIGNGTKEESNTPICISDLEGNTLYGKEIIDVWSDGSTVIAKDKEGKIYAWGDNTWGELGASLQEDCSTLPICINDETNEILFGKEIIDIQINNEAVIARDSENKIYTWGLNATGVLGTGEEDRNIITPTCISEIEGNALQGKNITQIYHFIDKVIAKDSNGKIYTWGQSNYMGQLGNGTTESSYVPVCISDINGNVLNGKDIVNFYTAGNTIIGRDSNGKIYTWGDNSYLKLGNDSEDSYSTMPICISDIEENALYGKNIIEIASNNNTIIAKDSDGKIYIWGEEITGNSTIPICISDIQDNAFNGKIITDIDINNEKVIMATDSNGKIYVCGTSFIGNSGFVDSQSNIICLTDTRNIELENKVVEKFSINNVYLTYIITEKETYIYEHYYDVPV